MRWLPKEGDNLYERNNRWALYSALGRRLGTPFGPKICAPAFREIDPTIGLITRCVWGKKENGAVFCHPAAWVVQAEALLGRGVRAWAYFRKLLPGRIPQETFRPEPYVYSQYITSDEHQTAGRASHSWQTGTAAWMYRVAYDYILGVRPAYEGLVIDPAIPADWPGFKVERVFRGARYIIEVENPDGFARGKLRGRLIQYGKQSPESLRRSLDDLHSLENSIKVRRKQLDTLHDDVFVEQRAWEEAALKAAVAASPELTATAGTAWGDIARAQQTYRNILLPYTFTEGAAGFNSQLYFYARALVRSAAERAKPNTERLREYTDAALPRIRQSLAAETPVYPDLEQVKLSFALERMREWLGPDDPLVRSVLGSESPARGPPAS